MAASFMVSNYQVALPFAIEETSAVCRSALENSRAPSHPRLADDWSLDEAVLGMAGMENRENGGGGAVKHRSGVIGKTEDAGRTRNQDTSGPWGNGVRLNGIVGDL